MAPSKENAQVLNTDVLRFLEANFPQWLLYVRTLEDKDDDQDFLELTIPDPPGVSHEHPLQISTWGEEVTVSFGEYHTHFPWPQGYDGSSSPDQVLNFVQALLHEDIVIASVWTEGRCKMSSPIRSNDLERYHPIAGGDHELRFRSWRGTYDKVFPVDWQSYLKASHP